VPSSFAATYYVDATTGSDNNSGLSPLCAWKSIEKVNHIHLVPGDTVLFRRGDVFRGNLRAKSGSEAARIVYSAYGNGKKPVFYGSIERNTSTDWTKVAKNVWQTSGLDADIGNIIFDHEAAFGIKVPFVERLNKLGEFWYDKQGKNLLLYSAVNPSTFYYDIELAVTRDIIKEINTSYVTYENLDLRYGGAHGIGGDGTHDIIIRSVDISYMGGGYLFGFDTTRYGNGVEFYNSAENNVVEQCTFSQIYDAAMTSQGDKPHHTVRRLYFINNIVSKCEQSFELWIRGEGSVMTDIYFDNNTCMNAGYGITHAQRPDVNGAHLLFWGFGNGTVVKNIFIRNNIFYNARDWSIFWNTPADIIAMSIDSNCWFMTEGPIAKLGDDKIDFVNQWNEYVKKTGQDKHSIAKDPLLQGADCMLAPASPCIDAGLTLDRVNTDFTGSLRKRNYYDIGAYEYSP
jgi:hypothetical protein